jgi:hypothetical protein
VRPRNGSRGRASPEMESEKFVVKRKERAARSAAQPTFSIAHTVRSRAQAGSDSGSGVVGSSVPGARTGSVKLAGRFGPRRYRRKGRYTRKAVGE